jgi:hypothetical protein
MIMHLKKSPLYFLLALFTLLFYANSFATTVTFSATQSNPTNFMGFGAMVWNADNTPNVSLMYQLPGFRFARINHQVRLPAAANWASFPTTGTGAPVPISQYYNNYWVPYGDGSTNLSGLNHGATTAAQVQYLYLASIPCAFINSNGYGSGYCVNGQGDPNCNGKGGCTLINKIDLQSLANYIAAGVQHFTDKYNAETSCPGCYSANYVELSNEPNGTWDVQFTTSQYTTLVQYVYNALQSLGAPYNQTKITGPGVGNIDWSTSTGTDTYTSAILANSTALANLGAFSVHNYIYAKSNGTPVENLDAGTSINGYGQTAMRYYFPKWYNSPKSKASAKPVIVSEVNTEATGFHGHTYTPANGTYLCDSAPYNASNCTIINTTSFGVRMYTYLISLLAGGANASLYWEAKDQSWESPGGAGLVDVNGNYKTNYYAMQPLFENIQPNSKILVSPSTQAGNDIYSVAFLSPVNTVTGQQCVTIALANGTGSSSTLARTTTVTGLPKNVTLSSSSTTLFSQSTATGSTVYQGQLTTPDPHTTTLSLSASGTLTHTTSLANDTAVTVQACYPN